MEALLASTRSARLDTLAQLHEANEYGLVGCVMQPKPAIVCATEYHDRQANAGNSSLLSAEAQRGADNARKWQQTLDRLALDEDEEVQLQAAELAAARRVQLDQLKRTQLRQDWEHSASDAVRRDADAAAQLLEQERQLAVAKEAALEQQSRLDRLTAVSCSVVPLNSQAFICLKTRVGFAASTPGRFPN